MSDIEINTVMDIPGNPIELVAIGASAGGVEALSLLLAALPADFPAAVAIVLHLPPDRISLLAQLFDARCALPVKEVEDKEPVVPGIVYFAAPDYHMLVEPGGTFSLSRDLPVHFSRPAIDLLLESAAQAYREHVLGIVLTGSSVDGADGLLQIREMGGQAWVQEPSEARAGTMPAAALRIAGADRVLGLPEMASALSLLFSSSNLISDGSHL